MLRRYFNRTAPDILAALKERRSWLALGSVVLLQAIGGPFGSYDRLILADRLVMWAMVALTTFLAGVGVFFALRNLFPARWAKHNLVTLLAALLTSVPVAAIAVLVDNLYLGAPINQQRFAVDWTNLILFVLAMMALLGLTRSARDGQILRERDEATSLVDAPAFLDRIRRHLGTELYYLSANDHYVLVRTSRGQDLILMRFGDAVRDLAGYDGLQVHRRHWVARAAVLAVERHGGRTMLLMADGMRLPVSRAYRPMLRASGVPAPAMAASLSAAE